MIPIKRKANSVEMKNTNDHHGAEGGIRRLRRPRLLTYAAVLAMLAAIPVATAAAGGRSLATPTGLQNFRLKLNDSRTAAGVTVPTFSRTPSFAWLPVRGATHYEFQLSTSRNFMADSSIIWSSSKLRTPAAAVPIALPWITGNNASLYWHVRAWGDGGAVSHWSAAHGFSMRWADSWNKQSSGDDVGAPQWLPSEPGYVRWTAVPGATGYDVWFTNLGTHRSKIVSTVTTVADEREAYDLSQLVGSGDNARRVSLDPPRFVEWRVRAERQVYGKTSNNMPVVSYGPWSGKYGSPAGVLPQTTVEAAPIKTVSAQVVSAGGSVEPHALMPAFVFSRDGYRFHRVYISTDKDCVNIVHVGSIVAGTAYAPRVSGPLALDPEKWEGTFLVDGSEGDTLRADGEPVTSNEVPITTTSPSPGGPAVGVVTTPDGATGVFIGPNHPATTKTTPPPVDLWDSNWDSGRYYWTVVPVAWNGSEYQDVSLPQDECQKGNVGTFQKRSTTPQLGSGAPYVTGLSPSGRLLSASGSQRAFYGVPLVAWTPSTGATKYDVEWSRTAYPWQKAGSMTTPATSALLPLKPGTWYYRVRGIDPWLPGNHMLTWSSAVRIHIARPTFSVRGG
jgi:hypothetical protein